MQPVTLEEITLVLIVVSLVFFGWSLQCFVRRAVARFRIIAGIASFLMVTSAMLLALCAFGGFSYMRDIALLGSGLLALVAGALYLMRAYAFLPRTNVALKKGTW